MYQHLFNLPQVIGSVGGRTNKHNLYKNYIKIFRKEKNHLTHQLY